jgi:hypothetical protein
MTDFSGGIEIRFRYPVNKLRGLSNCNQRVMRLAAYSCFQHTN